MKVYPIISTLCAPVVSIRRHTLVLSKSLYTFLFLFDDGRVKDDGAMEESSMREVMKFLRVVSPN